MPSGVKLLGGCRLFVFLVGILSLLGRLFRIAPLGVDSMVFHGEFDPGSGRTLAACLTHASRTDLLVAVMFRVG